MRLKLRMIADFPAANFFRGQIVNPTTPLAEQLLAANLAVRADAEAPVDPPAEPEPPAEPAAALKAPRKPRTPKAE